VAYQIDQEVSGLISSALNRSRAILTNYNRHLVAITNVLLEREVISGTEMDEIFEMVQKEIQTNENENLLTLNRPTEFTALQPLDFKTEAQERKTDAAS